MYKYAFTPKVSKKYDFFLLVLKLMSDIKVKMIFG